MGDQWTSRSGNSEKIVLFQSLKLTHKTDLGHTKSAMGQELLTVHETSCSPRLKGDSCPTRNDISPACIQVGHQANSYPWNVCWKFCASLLGFFFFFFNLSSAYSNLFLFIGWDQRAPKLSAGSQMEGTWALKSLFVELPCPLIRFLHWSILWVNGNLYCVKLH